MAYAAVVSLAQTIDQILNHDQSYPISIPENQEILSIRDHAIFLQGLLEDSPEKAMNFEGRISEVANKAEDVIEYYFIMLEKNLSHCGSTKSSVGPSKVKFRRQLKKVAEKIKSIAGEVIDIIKDSVTTKNVQFRDYPSRNSILGLAPPTGKNENEIVGFDDELMEIKSRFCGESSKLEILPIVGAGGIGKTTLARYAYHDPLIMEWFAIRAWVTVSQDYSLQEILSSLLVSMGVQREQKSGYSIELMAKDVYKSLKGRRYLVVMDDVWSTKVWDDVRMIFPDDGNESRIMLTTRQLDVAAYINYYCPLQMRLMDDGQSWNLLRHKVFGYEACPNELEDIGKQIARSCGGLPLSIVIMADLLSSIGMTRDSWEAIAEDVISAIATKDGQLEKIISSSYTQLPHHLRLCLLYMGGFPEDYEFRVSELIKLWVAEGFVKPYGSKTSEEVAEWCLEDLVNRSLVLVTSMKLNGKIKSCSLHDVVRDFCIRKVQEDKFLLPATDYLPSTVLRRYFLPQILKNQRRISLTSYDLHLRETIYNSPMRTIICILQRGYRSMGSVQNFPLLCTFASGNLELDTIKTSYRLLVPSFTPSTSSNLSSRKPANAFTGNKFCMW